MAQQVSSVPNSSVPRVHISAFNRSHPNLWFAQIEHTFRLNNIVTDADQFHVVATHLEDETLLAVEDLLLHLPNDNKYKALKSRLLEKFGDSNQSKLQRLLKGDEFVGMRPSGMLAQMRRLAPDQDDFIRLLFLQRLPPTIRPWLSVATDNLSRIASMADKMLESIATPKVHSIDNAQHDEVQAIHKTNPLSQLSAAIESMKNKIAFLEKKSQS
uniref:DUF7041 domain-containing protein n=1 Tax=Bactrocera latifrons TaxID=174628 RepID=A0A0K8TVK3_BACLA